MQHWPNLSPELQQRTYETVADMLRTHSNLIREAVITIPSLASIPLMSKFDSEINRLREHESVEKNLNAFVQRLRDENSAIVLQALREIVPWLDQNQSFIHETAVSEQPKPVVSRVTRALLDVCIKYSAERTDMLDLCAQSLGIIGCLDPNRLEATSSKRQALLLSNFDKAAEVLEWMSILFEDVLVRAFRSVSNARAQGFLAFALQELLRFCNFKEVASARLRASQSSPEYTRWMEMPEHVRNTLTPFLTSRYVVTSNVPAPAPKVYPIFSHGMGHNTWLRTWAHDMLWRAKGENARNIFNVLARIVRGHDIAIANFVVPYAALNIVLGGTAKELNEIAEELLVILSTESNVDSEKETLRKCSEVCTHCPAYGVQANLTRTCSLYSITCLYGYKRKEKPSALHANPDSCPRWRKREPLLKLTVWKGSSLQYQPTSSPSDLWNVVLTLELCTTGNNIFGKGDQNRKTTLFRNETLCFRDYKPFMPRSMNRTDLRVYPHISAS